MLISISHWFRNLGGKIEVRKNVHKYSGRWLCKFILMFFIVNQFLQVGSVWIWIWLLIITKSLVSIPSCFFYVTGHFFSTVASFVRRPLSSQMHGSSALFLYLGRRKCRAEWRWEKGTVHPLVVSGLYWRVFALLLA